MKILNWINRIKKKTEQLSDANSEQHGIERIYSIDSVPFGYKPQTASQENMKIFVTEKEAKTEIQKTFKFINYMIEGIRIVGLDKKESGHIYEVYSCYSQTIALQFLRSIPPSDIPSLYYVIVETPLGNFGKDLDGIFNEITGELITITKEDIHVPSQFQPDLLKAKMATLNYRNSSNPSSVLDEALAALERILLHPNYADSKLDFQLAILNECAKTHLRYFKITGHFEALERAMECSQQVVNQTPSGSLNQPIYMHIMVNVLRSRYECTRNIADLEYTIQVYEQMINQTPPNSPDIIDLITELGLCLSNRYQRTEDIIDLERAIHLHEQAVNQTPLNSPEMPNYLNNLGGVLREFYLRKRDMNDLERSINVIQQALNQLPPESSNLPVLLNNLGLGLRTKYEQTKNIADLERAIHVCKEALDHVDPNSIDLPKYLSNLGLALSKRYEQKMDISDLEQALEFSQQAVDLTPPDSPEMHTHLSTLGTCLIVRYEHLADIAVLDKAIKIFKQTLDLMPSYSTNHLVYLIDLGTCLRKRYIKIGNLADIELAIKVYEQALEQTPTDSQNMHELLTSFGLGLNDRYRRNGDFADLERAIQVFQQALDQTPLNSPNLPNFLTNLGLGLNDRYHRTGDIADLERSIQMHEQAANKAPINSPNMPTFLHNLGACFRDRYTRTGDLDDLKKSIELFQKEVDQIPSNSPDLPDSLNSLGLGLRDLYHQTGDQDDLERAIQYFEQAVNLTSYDSPNQPVYLSSLGISLIDIYKQTKNLKDLERSIEICQQAIDHTELDSPRLPDYLNNLGAALNYRYMHTGSLNNMKKSIEIFKQVTKNYMDVAVESSLGSARNWGNISFERQAWEEAAEAYNYVYKISNRLMQIQLIRRRKEIWLREIQGIPACAAYSIAKTGDLKGAVVALEQGIAQLLTEALESDRVDLEQLKELGYTDIYERYYEAAECLNKLERMEYHGDQSSLTTEELAFSLKNARSALDDAIDAIRHVQGYEHFLYTLDFADIQTVVRDKPIVYICVTNAGGLALILRPELYSEVTPLWLPDLNEKTLREAVVSYISAYLRWRKNTHDNSATDIWFKALNITTNWLWKIIIGRLIEALSPTKSVIIISTGLLGLLPFHAAWTDETKNPTGRNYALDNINFTYAPNVRTLAAAQAIATRVIPETMLAVNEPKPVKSVQLPNSDREVRTAIYTFPVHKILKHEEATREAVLAELPKYSVLHFSCHGGANLNKPLNGGLVMANNELLTLHDLLELHMKGARLAVLSACETGIPGTELPDELISLSTGFLQAGVAGVVSSLWSVADISTMMLMVRFYDLWRKDKLDSSEALRQAQRWVRDTTNGEKAFYFKKYMLVSSSDRMPSITADTLYKALVLLRPEERDFSHPFHWAAFSYMGA